MEQTHGFDGPGQRGVRDQATLYLCRQGPRWVVVLDAPRATGALRLTHSGRDSLDACAELLARARRACPKAAVISTDGALEDADYEWRIEVCGYVACAGDLGVALHRELAASLSSHVRVNPRFGSTRGCHWGLSPSALGRPRSF